MGSMIMNTYINYCMPDDMYSYANNPHRALGVANTNSVLNKVKHISFCIFVSTFVPSNVSI